MGVKIDLRLSGLDLRKVESYLRIPEELAELGFRANGPISIATVYSEASSPALEAADWARKIAKLMPGVRVVGVYRELVSTTDIAARCGVAPEAARLWAAGKRRAKVRPFPEPADLVGFGTGGKTTAVYLWSEVAAWVRDVLGVDPEKGTGYLSSRQVADLDAELAHLEAEPARRLDRDWSDLHTAVEVVSAAPSRRAVSVTTTTGVSTIIDEIDETLATADVGRRRAVLR